MNENILGLITRLDSAIADADAAGRQVQHFTDNLNNAKTIYEKAAAVRDNLYRQLQDTMVEEAISRG